LVIVVLLFGAKKIPELAKGIGSGIKSFKEEMKTVDTEEEKKEIDNKTTQTKVESKETETKKEV
jgi:sec-independent protein translocase protein TatA